MAEEVGLSQSTVNAITTGRSKQQRDSTLKPIANYFGITVQQIRGYEDIPGISDGVSDTSAAYYVNKYPVVPPEKIDAWLRGEAQKSDFEDHLGSSRPKGERTFVFEVSDSSMSGILEIGSQVFVDPDLVVSGPTKGRKIALIRSGGAYSVRYEDNDLGRTVYNSHSPGFKTLSEIECDFVGYVVAIPETSLFLGG